MMNEFDKKTAIHEEVKALCDEYYISAHSALEILKIERLDLLRESLYRISGHEETPTPTVFGKPIKKERQ